MKSIVDIFFFSCRAQCVKNKNSKRGLLLHPQNDLKILHKNMCSNMCACCVFFFFISIGSAMDVESVSKRNTSDNNFSAEKAFLYCE